MAFDVTCERCGKKMQWSVVAEDVWICRSCRTAEHTQPTLCSYASCASWADTEGPDGALCWYHAAHTGIHPDGKPYKPDHTKKHAVSRHKR